MVRLKSQEVNWLQNHYNSLIKQCAVLLAHAQQLMKLNSKKTLMLIKQKNTKESLEPQPQRKEIAPTTNSKTQIQLYHFTLKVRVQHMIPSLHVLHI